MTGGSWSSATTRHSSRPHRCTRSPTAHFRPRTKLDCSPTTDCRPSSSGVRTPPSLRRRTSSPSIAPDLRRPTREVEEAPHLRPDVRVPKKVEVVHAPELPPTLHGKREVLVPPSAPVRAGRLDQQVPDQPSHEMRRVGGDGHA